MRRRTANTRWTRRLFAWPRRRRSPPSRCSISSADELRRRVGALPNVASARTERFAARIERAKPVVSLCPYCAVGCSTLAYVSDEGKLLDVEGNPESPINGGHLCPKGSAIFGLTVNDARWTTRQVPRAVQRPSGKTPLDWALDRIAEKFKETRERDVRAHGARRQARQSHARHRIARRRDVRHRRELPAAKADASRPASSRSKTRPEFDIARRCPVWAPRSVAAARRRSFRTWSNADCILIEGSNFAECHPVAFRFVMKAKERGAKIIHVDPRFTRTSAVADLYAPIRSGTDIVFLGALDQLAARERALLQRVRRRIHQRVVSSSRRVQGHRRPRRPVLGLHRAATRKTRRTTSRDGARHGPGRPEGRSRHLRHVDVGVRDGRGAALRRRGNGARFPSATRRCSIRAACSTCCAGTSRATRREMVEDVCGTPRESSNRSRTCWPTTAGASARPRSPTPSAGRSIPSACSTSAPPAILQMLLGNMGRPGGGIMALRGHANIQGATDIATLYDLLPGYLADALGAARRADARRVSQERRPRRPAGGRTRRSTSSRCSRRTTATRRRSENDYCFEYLPQIDRRPLDVADADRDEGRQRQRLLRHRQNPASSGQNAELARAALERLEWMVVHRRVRNRDGVVLAPRRRRPDEDRHRDVLLAGRDRARKRRHDGQHQPPAAMARQGRRAGRRDASRDLVLHLSARHAPQGALCGFDRSKGPPDPRPDVGLSARGRARARARRTVGASRCCKRSTATTSSPASRATSASKSLRSPISRTTARPRAARGSTPASVPTRRPIARAIAHERRLDLARLGLRVAGQPAHALQSRLGRSRRQAVERAQEVHVVGRRGEEVGRPRRSGFPGRQSAATRRRNRARAASTRTPAAIRSSCSSTAARRSSSAGTLKDGPFPAHYEPVESVVRKPASTGSRTIRRCANGTATTTAYNGAENPRLPVRADDLSADRAVGHHDALRAVACRIAAGAVRRDRSRTRGRARASRTAAG